MYNERWFDYRAVLVCLFVFCFVFFSFQYVISNLIPVTVVEATALVSPWW